MLRTSQLQHRDGSYASCPLRVGRETGIPPGLLGVDTIPRVAGQLVDGHTVGIGSSFDGAFACSDEVVVPVRIGRRASLGREHIDRVLAAGVGQVHGRIDILAPGLATAVMYEDERCTFETTADSTLVRAKLSDDLLVPVIRRGHVRLLALP